MTQCCSSKKYKNVHVCITGGSDGLGFALAQRFIEEEANVSIIARSPEKLEKAKEALQQIVDAKKLETRVVVISGDCCHFDSVQKAMREAESENGPVDILIANAGTSLPGLFLDLDISDFESQIQLNYLGTVYSVKSVIDSMIERKTGEIVLVSSALGVIGLTGYSAYAPSKWAVRGFADCLRMELQSYGISVRIAYPPNMQTTGYNEELKRTPKVVDEMMKVSGDTVFSADDVSKAILKGMKQNKYHLPSPDTLQTLSQSSMTSISPAPYFVLIQAVINFIVTLVCAYFVGVFDRITAKSIGQKSSKK